MRKFPDHHHVRSQKLLYWRHGKQAWIEFTPLLTRVAHDISDGLYLLLLTFLPAGCEMSHAAKFPVIMLPGILGSTLVDQSNRS